MVYGPNCMGIVSVVACARYNYGRPLVPVPCSEFIRKVALDPKLGRTQDTAADHRLIPPKSVQSRWSILWS